MLQEILKEVAEGRVRQIRHKTFPISIFNYNEECQFKKAFNKWNMKCRGLVIHDNGTILARPFEKFFNYEEIKNPKFSSNDIEEIWTKEDGSLIICFWFNDQWITITRGSWVSEQAFASLSLLTPEFLSEADKTKTYLFELVGPSNRNVIMGYDFDELILLGVIDTLSGCEAKSFEIKAIATQFNFRHPKVWTKEEFSYEGIKNIVSPTFEGVVLLNKYGERCKIKSNTYVSLHKNVTNITDSRIFELWQSTKGATLCVEGIPDEFFDEINKKILEVDARWEDHKLSVIKDFELMDSLILSGKTRKDIALENKNLIRIMSSYFKKTKPEDFAYKEFCSIGAKND